MSERFYTLQIMMENVYWCFSAQTYNELDEFVTAVNDYTAQLCSDLNRPFTPWDPQQPAAEAATINLRYEAWLSGPEELAPGETLLSDSTFDSDTDDDGYWEVDINLTVPAANGQVVTQGELLFTVHNALARKDLGDHIFFEGFGVEDGTFWMHLGS